MGNTIILDVDGVLADSSDRTPLAEEGLIDQFYALVDTDKPILAGVEIAKVFESIGLYNVLYLTGRPELCREGTLRWLRRTVCECIEDHRLLMRESYDVDYRGFKEKVVRPFKDDVIFAVDDDYNVVQEMKSLGIPALHFQQPGVDFTSFWNNRNGRAQVVATGVEDEDCAPCAEKKRKARVGR